MSEDSMEARAAHPASGRGRGERAEAMRRQRVRDVSAALGMRVERIGTGWQVQMLDKTGRVMRTAPASTVERRMWDLLVTPESEW